MRSGNRPVAEPGPQPTARSASRLSRSLIVDLAVALADAEGVSSVSMGRLGKELGVSAMSLYRYVESKSDLDAAMAERVLEDLQLPPETTPGESWQDVTRGIVQAWADLVVAHPGAVRQIYAGRPATPTDMLPAELFANAALAAGFTAERAALAYRTVVLFVDSVLLTADLTGDSGQAGWRDLPASLLADLPGVRQVAPYADSLTYREIFANGVEVLIAGIELRGLR